MFIPQVFQRISISILVLFAPACAYLSQTRAASLVTAQEPRIRSILLRENDVFASTPEGLFRASLVEKKWVRLPCPDAIPPDGFFATQSKTAKTILYFVPRTFARNMAEPKGKVFGLYVSHDDGNSWRLISKDYDFWHVFLHQNGSVYAIVETLQAKPPEKPPATAADIMWRRTDKDGRTWGIRWRALVSKDLGVSWRDITGGIPAGVELIGITNDPDHPDLVSLIGSSIRFYILQAEDENYNWKMIRPDWQPRPLTEETFFSRGASSTWILHKFTATLSNYFKYDFGPRPDMSAYDIVPDQTAYEFDRGSDKNIKVAVQLYPEKATMKLIDFGKSLDLWGLRVRSPDGKMSYVAPVASKVIFEQKEREEMQRQYRERPDIQSHQVSSKEPYERALDLSQLYDFSQAGTYKVQLVYDNMQVAERVKEEWCGSFSGRTFTVTIKK